MSDPVQPLILDIDTPLPDAGHEALRASVVQAIYAIRDWHLALAAQVAGQAAAVQGGVSQLRDTLAATRQELAQTQADLAALTARVTALENPTPSPGV